MIKEYMTSQTQAIEPIITEDASPSFKNTKQDVAWMLSLYGTAIGAGTLFLPIDAGLNGIFPLIIMTLLAFPMTFFSHRALCRFVLSGSGKENNITDVVRQHFGNTASKILNLLYFFAIYPILLMYSVAITNTTQSFIINQIGIAAPPRILTSLVLIGGLMAIVRLGQATTIKLMSVLVYPFVATLMFLSIYLIPYWSTAIFHQTQNAGTHSMSMTIWLLIPVMVFAFNHSPIISSFAVNQKHRFGARADEQSSQILKYSHMMMIGTVMIFVFSCVFSLSPHDLAMAKQQNISILSYLANHLHTPFIAYIAPVVAFIAIAKSFLGHYLGAKEGLQSLMAQHWALHKLQKFKYSVEIFIVLSCWLVATINPNILKMIETLSGPIIAIILFLMPMYAIAKIPVMRKYQERSNIFITIIGALALSAILYGFWGQ